MRSVDHAGRPRETDPGATRQTRRKTQTREMFLTAGTAIVSCMLGAPSFAQSAATAPATTPPVRQCYPPQYSPSGELVLPKNYREWIFVGSPLTPNALNDGHANFPE